MKDYVPSSERQGGTRAFSRFRRAYFHPNPPPPFHPSSKSSVAAFNPHSPSSFNSPRTPPEDTQLPESGVSDRRRQLHCPDLIGASREKRWDQQYRRCLELAAGLGIANSGKEAGNMRKRQFSVWIDAKVRVN